MIRWTSTCLALVALAGLLGPPAHAQEFPERYALLIGIDRYEDPNVPKLKYARRDAETIAKQLELQGYNVTVLPDAAATRDAIVRQLVLMQATLRPQDSFVLYYAGHGLIRDRNKQVYWLNYSGDPRRPDLGGLRAHHVAELVSEIPARRKLILLDHCYSGSIGDMVLRDGDGGRDGTEAPPPVLAGREAIPVELEHDLSVDAQPEQAMFILAAARNVAFEVSSNQHGIFTEVLLRALKEAAADVSSNDGAVSIVELITFVRREVPSLSRSKGLEQRTMDKMPQGGDITAGSWQPFLRTLSPTEVQARYQVYRNRLREWSSRNLLTAEVQTLSENLLERWRTAPPASLAANDQKAIAVVRRLIDDSSRPDEDAANELSEKVRYWSEDP